MKHLKLLTALTAFTLVFSLGACQLVEEDETSDDGSEESNTSNESSESSEDGNSSSSSSEPIEDNSILLASYDFANKNESTQNRSGIEAYRILAAFDESYTDGAFDQSPVKEITIADRVSLKAGGGSYNSNLQLNDDCLKIGWDRMTGELAFRVEGCQVSKVGYKAVCWNNSYGSDLYVNDTFYDILQTADKVATVDDIRNYLVYIDLTDTVDLRTSEDRILLYTLDLYGYIEEE